MKESTASLCHNQC